MTAILHSNLETDLRLAVMLSGFLRVLLADRASIRQTGAVLYLGDVAGTGSDTSRESYVGLDGYNRFQATGAENSDIGTTALTTSSADIAVARAGIRRDQSDLARLTNPSTGQLDPYRLAESMVSEFEMYFNQLVADAIDSFSSTVGTSGADMTHDDYMDAIYTLELASVPGPYFCDLHPRQLADWQESLRAEGGATQFMAATAEMLRIKGQGFVGDYLGVQNFKSTYINASGGNRYGAMWGLGALGYKTGTMSPPPGATMIKPGSVIVVEFQRDGSAALTEVIGHAYCGLSILENSRGCAIVTSST